MTKEKFSFVSFSAGIGECFLFLAQFSQDICLRGTEWYRFGLLAVAIIFGIPGFESKRSKLAKIGIVSALISFLLSFFVPCA